MHLHRGATESSHTNYDQFTSQDSVPQVEADQSWQSACKWIGAGLAAGILMATTATPAQADEKIGLRNLGPKTADRPIERDQYGFPIPRGAPKGPGVKGPVPVDTFLFDSPKLETCKNNKKFNKRIKDEVQKMQKRQSKGMKGTPYWNALQADVEQALTRQKAYGDRLCGAYDGLPRVQMPGFGQRMGIWGPAIAFLYTAGWIGWAGREYLLRTKDVVKEIFIDVPLLLTCCCSAFAWPVASWKDITNGDFIVPDSEISSPNKAIEMP